jgi:hypothetical protein
VIPCISLVSPYYVGFTCVNDMWASMSYKGLNKIAMTLRELSFALHQTHGSSMPSRETSGSHFPLIYFSSFSIQTVTPVWFYWTLNSRSGNIEMCRRRGHYVQMPSSHFRRSCRKIACRRLRSLLLGHYK